VYRIAEGVWHHAPACIESPKAYGITRQRVWNRRRRMASRASVYEIDEGAWHHAPACIESPKAYGITEGAFLRLDDIQGYALILVRLCGII